MKRPSKCEGCIACPGSANYNPDRTGPFVPPKGPTGSIIEPTAADFKGVKLVVVAMAPAFNEIEEGEPLVGPSFHEIHRAMGDHWNPRTIVKLNYVNCRTHRPGKTVDYVNRTPTAAEAKDCTPRFLIPFLRAMAEAERQGETINLWVLGQDAFKVVFQDHYGSFSGSKSSRGQRLNRELHTYDHLADRIEKWTTKSRKKERKCIRCNQPITLPRIRICPTCRTSSPHESSSSD